MKKILTPILLLAMSVCLQAQTLYVQLLDDEEQVAFPFAGKPKITFGNGTVIVAGTTFQISNVKNLSFTSKGTPPVTSVAANSSDGKIYLYPNPVKDELELSLEIPTQNLRYQIFDLSGTLLKTEQIGSAVTKINMQSFRTGVYVISINRGGQHIESFKIIKQ